ncbi:MAG TPA: hypothetical protein VHZ25_18640 [Acidobacteriaceae bacterium]|jgi:hypothetical protein|nr:hypothetical protein [Acidobacteriaceae bacterium]
MQHLALLLDLAFKQSSSQAVCLLFIDAMLAVLIFTDRRRHSATHPYVQTLVAYVVIEALWVFLGRPV